METRIIKDTISKEELKALAHEQYGDIIKVAVDVTQEIMGVGGELHIDIQSLLIEQENSQGQDTWGINLYLEKTGDEFIEFDSMINLKPLLGNKTRGVESLEVQNKIREIVGKLVK
ncbi:MAG: hypothetical protein A3C70_02370 [Candidatus Zambryskibacteria bacterium RIFCSPHIGHO2_02_FULL_43_14]|uniref:Uncharacterized protein n=1 Tax=Candidatus Zambryskibacteria bacterium RIFCSPHIGHO2_02_FULL_43_14 TaxID=1802748 RepID=A0A1G2TII3_9BACT|nr:MAG: hypothetical protein A2829_00060 [Candidatus Zambryskibacteria bacterium RIFCSPHIGHO2_01_FULL_43_60]OHA97003.1 MAG: hypothetical protein A3C70_02370 [Candidatus Zambryskibacteria bacterium RIFCSPHIGHO2_02_FULL_43_14]OHB03728.1 MAG: hypothetical protein A3B03_01925 [Candidatus Zambryskibacteria bacterium RIFCSPLOWO2_01_FULL_42_41]